MSIHYTLRPEVDKDSFLGGVLAAGDTSIDVLEALREGGGRIEIADDDHVKAAVLDGYQPLERVPAPDGDAVGDQATEPGGEAKTAPASGSGAREGISLPADGVMRTTELRGKPAAASTHTDDKPEA